MTGINLRVATLKNAKLKNCNLRGATLAGTDLEVRDCWETYVNTYASCVYIYRKRCNFITRYVMFLRQIFIKNLRKDSRIIDSTN